MNWIVYILKCSDGSLYTGITNNLSKRMHAHAQGKGAKYTVGRTPVQLVYQEEFQNRSEATKKELEIKKLSRRKKLELLRLKIIGGVTGKRRD